MLSALLMNSAGFLFRRCKVRGRYAELDTLVCFKKLVDVYKLNSSLAVVLSPARICLVVGYLDLVEFRLTELWNRSLLKQLLSYVVSQDIFRIIAFAYKFIEVMQHHTSFP